MKYYPTSPWRLAVTEKVRFPATMPEAWNGYPLLPDTSIRNIILFIGDGMGISQLTAARIATYGPNGRLHIERMPITGLVATHTADDLITKSDAAATALATGFKTKNNMISMSADSVKLYTLLEAARDHGLSIGLVTTALITDATPAAFASHVTSRGNLASIAAQLIENRVDVLLGGGKAFFMPKSEAGSQRTDEIDLIEKAEAEGYTFVDSQDRLQEVETGKVLGLFTLDKFHRPPLAPSLPEMTAKAIALLNQNEKGFFLMVEEERIDSASHKNQITAMIEAMQQFDQAVRVGLEFARRDRQTLVIVTADHETGGLNIDLQVPNTNQMQVLWNSTKHTGQPVPLFAFGPHAHRFTGMKDNTEIPKLSAELLGLPLFLPEHNLR